jgi:hypothetical protein
VHIRDVFVQYIPSLVDQDVVGRAGNENMYKKECCIVEISRGWIG